MPPILSSAFHCIASALAARRRQRQDRRELMAMGEAELRDLGIGRGQIPAALLRPDGAMPGSATSWHAAAWLGGHGQRGTPGDRAA